MSQNPLIYYIVLRERGENWNNKLPMRHQEQWEQHAAFMDALVDDGFIILGGLLGDGEEKFCHVVVAENEQVIESRFIDDPWTSLRLLRTISVERWEILLKAGK